ncbi:hypothetical protein ACFFX0_01405 [Citricoccus parietis]|uniref:Uncharacterized protein n=1 Tax=Citricoccus parietis TaxID=592307 RepID=A0ABV5FTC5_9MICC
MAGLGRVFLQMVHGHDLAAVAADELSHPGGRRAAAHLKDLPGLVILEQVGQPEQPLGVHGEASRERQAVVRGVDPPRQLHQGLDLPHGLP